MKRTTTRIQPSEITPQAMYLDRRRLIAMGLAGTALVGAGSLSRVLAAAPAGRPQLQGACATRPCRLPTRRTPSTRSPPTTTTTNSAPTSPIRRPIRRISRPRPWSVAVDGEAEVKGTFTIEDILKPHALEERVYRLRCVEAWSHGHSVDGLSARRPAQALQAHVQGQVRRVHHAEGSQADAWPARPACWTGPTWRACASTKPCTRWPSLPWGCMGKCCPTRMAPHCAWSRPGNTASRASSPSCASASPRSSRATAGRSRPQ